MTVAYINTTAASSLSSTIAATISAVTASTQLGHGLPAAIPVDEVLFWTRSWQEGEAESAAAREAGEVHEFANGREAVRWLLSDDD